MKTTVVYHSADYDGIFSREIARKFLPDATLIGWDFPDKPLDMIDVGQTAPLYIIDLPVDRVFGLEFSKSGEMPTWLNLDRVIWIDHHKSSIDSHPKFIPGYRIDGVAACRLAWQWFSHQAEWELADPGQYELPVKQMFLDRIVTEPLAVRLAGEYDVWDHRDNDADVAFQFGLDAQEQLQWEWLLGMDESGEFSGYRPSNYCSNLINDGRAAMRCYAKRDADVMRTRSFLAKFAHLNFLCLNTARCNSNTFSALDVPETGHDALMAFYTTGKDWNVSLYHAAHRKDLDLSDIAKSFGGGGHRGACGFRSKELPFLP